MENLVDIGLNLTYFLLGVSILAAVVMPLINAIGDPKSILKFAGAIVVLAVVFGISYSVAGNEVLATYTKAGVGATGSQVVGGMLNMTYVLTFVAVVGMVYTEFHKIIK
ncbi:hypothetical protein [Aureibacter tunicatorum]|uniref:Uncharacterized protein n=1 Tax=Aureibacter tunicatorum TaxID=866807 RepID=A0AAE4BUX5_9BACT|nr:hypothetical protein [Aureibacter tunicatorum]MDR6241272.1 hypothetical protein [Aureibacter tunicatorum]BDD03532.1 hypothetical protein AUTU_10150 [Aureibacter tunicatorum]